MLDVILGNPILLALAALVGMAIAFGALLGFAAVRFEVEGNPLSDQINAILPQTQCGQCGYPGCRPYAEAIADGDSINKCPPGGEDTIQALANLLDVEPEPLGRGTRCRSRAHGCVHPRGRVHRLHQMHTSVSCGCHSRCSEAHAHRDHR